MAQKMHNHGRDGKRYFWRVSIRNGGTAIYRSRHADASGVKRQLRRMGKSVRSIKPVMA